MIDNTYHIVFDLDDTLYKEIDFVKSAYSYINRYIKIKYGIDTTKNSNLCLSNNINLFDHLKDEFYELYNFSLDMFLELYRFHFPNISLNDDAKNFIEYLSKHRIKYSIITDGRSISQRNKIKALNLEKKANSIVISEETGYSKLKAYNFKLIEKKNPQKKYIYIGDNTSKDFIIPNQLGWKTICIIDNGFNIHKQNFNLDKKYMPLIKINSLNDLIV